MLPDLNLALFFTKDVSLAAWDGVGSLDRELALYRRLQSRGVNVTFITYGDASELQYQERIPGITICCNRWNLPQRWYERLIPFLHRKELRQASVIKTNQTPGAEIALAAGLWWKKPFLARCGYMWSKNLILEYGPDSNQASEALSIEKAVFNGAGRIAVTTGAMRDSIVDRFPSLAGRVAVIPNYVDTEVFKPFVRSNPQRPLLCFVGRLEHEKNLPSLLEAVDGLDLDLQIIGQGSLHDRLACTRVEKARVRLLGSVPNHRLADHFNRCTLFVLPSLFEGHPKVLLEAMACGAPVLGTDVTGINEVVSHGHTGWLCDTDPGSIRAAIVELLADAALREKLGANAAQYIAQNLSLDRIVELELECYCEAIGGKRAFVEAGHV